MAYAAHERKLRSDLDRLAAMVRSAEHLNKPVPGLDWTAAQVASHVIIALRGLTGAIRGDVSDLVMVVPDGGSGREMVANMNARALEMLLVTEAAEAADGIEGVGGILLDAIASAQPDMACPTPWYGGPGATRPAGILAAVAHGEVLMHGLDIARALEKPWPISEETAEPIARAAMMGMMPHMLKPAAADFKGAFEIRLRTGSSFVMTIADGSVAIGPSKVDCTISITPSAALLIGYGRTPLWRLMAQGKVFAYGRRPWKALRFHTLFDKP